MVWNVTHRARTRLRWFAAVLALLVSAFHFGASAWRTQAFGIVDFPIFATRTAEFVRTGVLYPDAADPTTYEPAAAVYKFPPLYAMLLLPFVRDGVGPRLYLNHWILQLLIYAVTVALLIRELRPGRAAGLFVVLVLLVALNHEPFFENLWKQQVESSILLLLVLGLVCIRRGLNGAAGALVGLAIMLKVYPAVMLAYFVIRRRWAALGWCAATVLLVTVATVIVFGPEQNRVYYFGILPHMLDELPVASSENLSLGRYAQTVAGLGPVAAKSVVRLIAVMLLAATTLVVHRTPRGEREALAFGAFIPVLLLVMPNVWVSYQMLLLLPLVGVLAIGTADRDRAYGPLGMVLAAAGLFLFYWPCAPPAVPWPCASTPFFLGLLQLPRSLHDLMVGGRGLATVLVWSAAMAVLWRHRASPRAEAPVVTGG